MEIAQSHFHNFRSPEYEHRQTARMYWLLLGPALALAVAAVTNGDSETCIIWLLISGLLAATALSFTWLDVRDEGDWLAVRFGPLPIFSKRIRYADIASAEACKSSWIDGWGIHWILGRGWIFNLWGFDCVRFQYHNGKVLRVGTDDPVGLSRFVNRKLSAPA